MEEEANSPTETPPPWAWIRAVNDIISNEPLETGELPVELASWLYLSDMESLLWNNRDPTIKGEEEGAIANNKGITHCLTTNAEDEDFLQELSCQLAAAGITDHHVIAGEDEEGYSMIDEHWEECRSYIESAKSSGGKVVVHCLAGVNRSALIVTAALMVLERIPVLEAVKRVKAKRRRFYLKNFSFQKQLCELAQKEGLLGEKPKGFPDTELELY